MKQSRFQLNMDLLVMNHYKSAADHEETIYTNQQI
jgi:hypothetical protein